MVQQGSSRQTGASWPTTALLVLVGVALTATVVLLITWHPTPPSLSAAPPASGTIAVTQQAYDDSRDVELIPTQGAAARVLATSTGILTSSQCRPGGLVESGKAVASIAGRPVLPLATPSPAYRDITVGTTGSDVDSLRAELTRLKLLPKANPVSQPADKQLVAQARRLAGLSPPTATSSSQRLPLGAFAWTPSAVTVMATCEVPVGSRVSTGTPLFTLSPPLTGLTFPTPEGAVPGARELAVDSVTVDVADGRVTAENDLSRVTTTPAWAAYQQNAGKVPVAGQWRLKTPIPVASLPAASLRVGTGGNAAGCVAVKGVAVPVRIIASSLGHTLVTFSGQWPATVDTMPVGTFRCG